MGKEWEDQQLMKLKARQEKRISELQKEVDAQLILPKQQEKKNEDLNPLPPDVE